MHITMLVAECSGIYQNHSSMHLLLVPFTGHLFIYFCSADLTKGLIRQPHHSFRRQEERKMTLSQTPKNCDSEEASRKKLHTLL